ncbi:sensor histidine kinase [Marivirga lumbricoides]|uniref:histidine kinase n=1 Tax=Marivirga lumbricoides TaxID=1046115 RepID=A0ABQ1LNG8_9BACT|nr:sensor histidine kinase [Marivirga lumbricoides]
MKKSNTMKKEEILVRLQEFELFKGVPSEQLEWFAEHSELHFYEEGDTIFKPGDAIDEILIIIEGAFRLLSISNQQEREIATKIKGEVSGFLPFSRAKNASGVGRVIEKTIILGLNRSYEREMLRDHYELCQVLVHEMTSRVREFTGFQKQTEKMAALGKLSAGLAHELNNPASAIVRSAGELKKHLSLQPKKFKKVIKIKLTEELTDRITDLLFDKIQSPSAPKSLMKRKDLEDDLSFLLEDLQVDDAMELAENLADYGFEEKDIQSLAEQVKPEDIGAILHWMSDNLAIEKMVGDIQESSERISTLVNSVKVYTHMDQGQEKSEVDLHEGIRNTLNILNHKIKSSGTKIKLDFDEEIPAVCLFVSEINQVWTNLLDNAIDAVAGSDDPGIILRTRQKGKDVQVCIIDNGKGVPDEIAARIWEPFFTTKEMGKGTGLGLELVKDIVEKHHGTIKLKSQPGSTTFELCLPIS